MVHITFKEMILFKYNFVWSSPILAEVLLVEKLVFFLLVFCCCFFCRHLIGFGLKPLFFATDKFNSKVFSLTQLIQNFISTQLYDLYSYKILSYCTWKFVFASTSLTEIDLKKNLAFWVLSTCVSQSTYLRLEQQ